MRLLVLVALLGLAMAQVDVDDTNKKVGNEDIASAAKKKAEESGESSQSSEEAASAGVAIDKPSGKSRRRRALEKLAEDAKVVDKINDQVDGDIEKFMKIIKPWAKYDFKNRRRHFKAYAQHVDMPKPTFLRDVSADGIMSFGAIKYDRDMNKAEKRVKLSSWADKYNVVEQLEEYLKAKDDFLNKMSQQRGETLDKLDETIKEADAILLDEKLSWKQAKEKLELLMTTDDKMLEEALRAFYPFVNEKKSRGRRDLNYDPYGNKQHSVGQGISANHGTGHRNHEIGSGVGDQHRHRDKHDKHDKTYDPYKHHGRF